MVSTGAAGTTAQLAAYMAHAQEHPLPPAVVERAKHHLIDTLAAILSGSRLLPGRATIAMIRSQGGTPEARVAGSDIVTSGINAAWANGMSAHADETDDHHTISRIRARPSSRPRLRLPNGRTRRAARSCVRWCSATI